MVAQNDPTFKTIARKYKLNFMGGTNVFKVNATEIPERLFKFVLFPGYLGYSQGGSFAG